MEAEQLTNRLKLVQPYCIIGSSSEPINKKQSDIGNTASDT